MEADPYAPEQSGKSKATHQLTLPLWKKRRIHTYNTVQKPNL